MSRNTVDGRLARGFTRDLPTSWRVLPASEFVALRYGKALTAGERKPGGVPVYGTNGLCGWHSEACFKGPGLVFGRKGQGPLGVEWCDTDYWVIDTAYSVEVDSTLALPRYVYFMVKYSGLNHLKVGAANPSLGRDRFGVERFPVPDLTVQRRIVDILSAYDDLIENNNRRMALLEESIRLLYREWFVYLRFPGHERVEVVDGVPEGWEQRAVKDAFSYLGGGTPSRKRPELWTAGTVDWYSPTDLTRSGRLFMEGSKEQINDRGLTQSSARLFPAWSVMFTSRATIGAVAINTGPATTNQGFINCLPNDQVPLYFLYCWLKANTEEFIARATGSTFKELSKSKFGVIPIVLPPMQLGQEFNELARPFADQALALQRQNARLREARDLLLPRLMDGRIPV